MTDFVATRPLHDVLPADVARLAQRKGGLLGMLLISGQLLDCRLEYLRSYRVNVRENEGQRWDIIVDAVTRECGVLEAMPPLEPQGGLAFSGASRYCSQAEAAEQAERFVRRLSARLFLRSRGLASQVETFYRPHWMAYYGRAAGSPSHFLHFPADAFSFHR